MLQNVAQFRVLLTLLNFVGCNSDVLSLQISKLNGAGAYFTPIFEKVIKEIVGIDLSLRCDLVCSSCSHPKSNYYDLALSWMTSSEINISRFLFEDFPSDKIHQKRMYWLLKSVVNSATKHFRPLKFEDEGEYFCISSKHDLLEVVEIRVLEPPRPFYHVTRFQFIIICISCILLAMLFFLILGSRAVIRRRALITNCHLVEPQPILESIGLNSLPMPQPCDFYIYPDRRTSAFDYIAPTSSDLYPSQNRRSTVSNLISSDSCDVSDPHPPCSEEDPPPSYLEAISAQNTGVNLDLDKAPPPYQ